MIYNCEKIIKEGLVYEGGFVNHRNDPGGATNRGITLSTFRQTLKPKATVDDLKKLTIDQAVHIYKKNYWDKLSCDQLPSGVDAVTYDFGINSGVYRSATYLQEILGVPGDGKIGPLTIKTCEEADPSEVVNRMCDDRLAFMQRAKHPQTGKLLWDTFGSGWQKRVDHNRKFALGLIDIPNITPQNINAFTGSDIHRWFELIFGVKQ